LDLPILEKYETFKLVYLFDAKFVVWLPIFEKSETNHSEKKE
jgi:hypothetical protein